MPADICPRCLVETGSAVRMTMSGDHTRYNGIYLKMICPGCLEAFYIWDSHKGSVT